MPGSLTQTLHSLYLLSSLQKACGTIYLHKRGNGRLLVTSQGLLDPKAKLTCNIEYPEEQFCGS